MDCQNAACYLLLQCRIKDCAQNCSIHRNYLKGNPIFEFSKEELDIIVNHQWEKETLRDATKSPMESL